MIDRFGRWMPEVRGPDGLRLSVLSGFFEGLAAAQSPEGPDGAPASLWGYVDESGNVVIEPRFNRVGDFAEGLAAVGIGENDDVMKYGYIDKTGAWVVKPQFEQAGPFREGVAAVGVRDAKGAFKMGYIDRTGAWVIQPQFEDAQSFSEGLALVWWPRSCGYIDKTGKLVIPREYGTDGWDFSGGVVRVGGGFYGSPSYIDKTGRVIWQGE